MSDVVIRVEGVSKLYRLLEVGTGFHPELTGYKSRVASENQ